MFLDSLINKPSENGASYRANVTRGHISGLNVSAPLDSTLSVRLRTIDGSHVLLQSVPLWYLSCLSNLRYGFNNAMQSLIQSIDTTGTDFATKLPEIASLNLAPVRVDLGSFKLEGDELEIELHVNTTDSKLEYGANGRDVMVSAFSDKIQKHHIYKYEVQLQASQNFVNSSILLAYVAENNGFYGGANTSFQVETEEGAFIASYRELLTSTLLNSSIELYADLERIMPVLHLDYSDTPGDVTVKAAGEGAENVRYLNMIRSVIPSMTEKTARFAVNVAKEKQTKFAVRNPKAYQRIKNAAPVSDKLTARSK